MTLRGLLASRLMAPVLLGVIAPVSPGYATGNAADRHDAATVPTRLPTGDDPIFRAAPADVFADALPGGENMSIAPESTPIEAMPVEPFGFRRISSGFGPRIDPLLGIWRAHSGIDLPGAYGTAVRASGAGQVVYAGVAGGYGQMVRVDHGGGLTTLYGHLARIAVMSSHQVRRGDVIGYLGSSGRSTGNHLHFEVRLDNRAVDPLGYLSTGWLSPALKSPDFRPAPAYLSEFARQLADSSAPAAATSRRVSAPNLGIQAQGAPSD